MLTPLNESTLNFNCHKVRKFSIGQYGLILKRDSPKTMGTNLMKKDI
jgi:hypothetical protein